MKLPAAFAGQVIHADDPNAKAGLLAHSGKAVRPWPMSRTAAGRLY